MMRYRSLLRSVKRDGTAAPKRPDGEPFRSMKILRKSIWVILCVTVVSLSIVSQETHRPIHGKIQWDCEECHISEAGHRLREPLEFQHQETGFPLLGSHQRVNCMGCHTALRFSQVGIECADCHADIHRGQLGTECENCHTTQDWEDRQEVFEIHSEGGFSLQGVHAVVDCEACHMRGDGEKEGGPPRTCEGCHSENFKATKSPDHIRAGFEPDCQLCHVSAALSWGNTLFEHPSTFELSGAHRNLDCIDCHAERFAGTPRVCYGCHETDYMAADDPSHIAQGFPTDCEICHAHASESWKLLGESTAFTHEQTGFPLLGSHKNVECIRCHRDLPFSNIGSECADCHTDIHRGQLGSECRQCHTTQDWRNRQDIFDMHSQRGFSLMGAHAIADCNACHVRQGREEYIGVPVECKGCHMDHFVAAQNPDHIRAGFEPECHECHSSFGGTWRIPGYKHPSSFELRGAHRNLECIDCHVAEYIGRSRDCYGCHESDYELTTDPSHSSLDFPLECELCHVETQWMGAAFDHIQASGFELQGAHAVIGCTDCHANDQFDLPRDCYGCHEDDYGSTTDPNHTLNTFGTDCTRCHTPDSWHRIIFDHHQTQFPLTGAHALLDCKACHDDGYTQTPKDCFSCHEGDFQSAEDPNHRVAGFPVDCQSCHNTVTWNETTWDHDTFYFPIYSGAHQGQWNSCNDCHVVPGNYKSFECLYCHAHRQTRMDTEHRDVSGYSYNSEACYGCHPSGDE
jgi:hypothetical protein